MDLGNIFRILGGLFTGNPAAITSGAASEGASQALNPGSFWNVDLMGTPHAPGIIPQTLLGLFGVGLVLVGALALVGGDTVVEVAAPEAAPIVQAKNAAGKIRAYRSMRQKQSSKEAA